MIPFNKPYFSGKETSYIKSALKSGKVSGGGPFTRKCEAFFEKKYGFKKAFLTTSCTAALEMAAILIDIQPGDEVIMPSYGYITPASVFALRGAVIIFVDSGEENPNMNISEIEPLITLRTKAIVPVHYGGMVCDMDELMTLARKYNLFVIEDAAQALNSYYRNRPAGSIGHLAAFSFHETKNITSGEGGLLAINDSSFIKRAEIIGDKGTNKTAFLRGETDKYEWIDTGLSFLPSDIIAALLWAQLQQLDKIQRHREELWESYYQQLKPLQEKGKIKLPAFPSHDTHNAHLFYLVCPDEKERAGLINALKKEGISSAFHFWPLHKSPYYKNKHGHRELPKANQFSECLLRLPMFYELSLKQVIRITEVVKKYYS